MAIRFNNNRDFFMDNRAWYEESVKAPMQELIRALTPAALDIDREIDARPHRCLARPMRDIRRLYGQPPYRDYSFMKFRRPGEARYDMLGLFFDLSDDGASYGMGIYEKNLPLMNALRHSIDVEGDHVERLIRPLDGHFTLCGNVIKRMKVPEHVPEALAPWYPLRSFYVQKEIRDFSLIKSPRLADEILRGFALMKGLYQYIQALTPIEG